VHLAHEILHKGSQDAEAPAFVGARAENDAVLSGPGLPAGSEFIFGEGLEFQTIGQALVIAHRVTTFAALYHFTSDHNGGALFADHDRWCLRITANQYWHNRCINDP
jgi:hypothetical protein